MNRIAISLSIVSITFAAITNVPADSLTNQVGKSQPGNRNASPKNRVFSTKTIENAHFDFLRALHAEEPKKSGKLLGRLSRSSKDLPGYKIKEYNSYLKSYFPNASSDHVQRYMIESYIVQKKWDEVQVGLLKFAYLYPNSSIYKKVLDNGYTLLQEEKYFGSVRDKFITLLNDAPKTGKMHSRYFDFLAAIPYTVC